MLSLKDGFGFDTNPSVTWIQYMWSYRYAWVMRWCKYHFFWSLSSYSFSYIYNHLFWRHLGFSFLFFQLSLCSFVFFCFYNLFFMSLPLIFMLLIMILSGWVYSSMMIYGGVTLSLPGEVFWGEVNYLFPRCRYIVHILIYDGYLSMSLLSYIIFIFILLF